MGPSHRRLIANKAVLQWLKGMSHLQVKRGVNGSISELDSKVTDDIVTASPLYFTADFAKNLGGRFPISEIILDEEMIFNGVTMN